jgi:hypothetical protein
MYLHALTFILAASSEDRVFRPRTAKATLAISEPYSARSANGTITKTFVVENDGARNGSAADITISSVRIAGDASHAFSVVQDDCTGTTLYGGDTCSVSVAFRNRPAAEARTATLLVSCYDEGRSADGTFIALTDSHR